MEMNMGNRLSERLSRVKEKGGGKVPRRERGKKGSGVKLSNWTKRKRIQNRKRCSIGSEERC